MDAAAARTLNRNISVLVSVSVSTYAASLSKQSLGAFFGCLLSTCCRRDASVIVHMNDCRGRVSVRRGRAKRKGGGHLRRGRLCRRCSSRPSSTTVATCSRRSSLPWRRCGRASSSTSSRCRPPLRGRIDLPVRLREGRRQEMQRKAQAGFGFRDGPAGGCCACRGCISMRLVGGDRAMTRPAMLRKGDSIFRKYWE